MSSYEREQAEKLNAAMTAAHGTLWARGNRSSASCIERAMDELDTAASAEIARMMERKQ